MVDPEMHVPRDEVLWPFRSAVRHIFPLVVVQLTETLQ